MEHSNDILDRRQDRLRNLEPRIQSLNEGISDFLRWQGDHVFIGGQHNLITNISDLMCEWWEVVELTSLKDSMAMLLTLLQGSFAGFCVVLDR